MRADFNEGFGEIAGVLLRVARYALERFGVGDVIFGVYHLAQVNVLSFLLLSYL